MSAHAVVLEVAALILLTLFLCQLVLKELNKTIKTARGVRKMIGLKDDGYESLRFKLRTMSDKDLIQFGKAASEQCKNR